MKLIHAVSDSKVTGCPDCYHSGIIHMMKKKESKYAYCSCALGLELLNTQRWHTNLHKNTRMYLERARWRKFNVEEFTK